MMAQSIGIATLTLLVGAFVISVAVIESKEAYRRWRKKKSPSVIRGYHER